MKILINDFGGYAFPVQLSKELAKRGYEVVHTFLDNIKTPHGNMDYCDIEKLQVMPVNLKNEFSKYNVVGRYKGETEYAGIINDIIDKKKPDVVISANTPLFAQRLLVKKCKQANIKFIYWCQDIHSIAIKNILSKKLPFAGPPISAIFKLLEITLLKQSDHIISITDDFNKIFEKWGISGGKLSVINNWAPVEELPVYNKCNSWAERFNVCNSINIIYSGTMGLKHDPNLIIHAAQQLSENSDVLFIIISNGIGAEMIKKEKERLGLGNIIILDFQEYNELPLILGSADVLISILEKGAAMYSVPSKVLTYLCSQRPVVLSISDFNLSAKILVNANAGICTKSGDLKNFTDALKILINDKALRENLGANGRAYAEENFNIHVIADKFIEIIRQI
jgi:colanic acid biosynthesis glycosyl transferase WcaI